MKVQFYRLLFLNNLVMTQNVSVAFGHSLKPQPSLLSKLYSESRDRGCDESYKARPIERCGELADARLGRRLIPRPARTVFTCPRLQPRLMVKDCMGTSRPMLNTCEIESACKPASSLRKGSLKSFKPNVTGRVPGCRGYCEISGSRVSVFDCGGNSHRQQQQYCPYR